MDEETIARAKSDADKFYPMAAEAEATYRDLLREEPIIFSRCLLRHKEEEATVEMAKARARIDPEFVNHVKIINAAHRRYLEADKAFEAIINWIKLATSYCYREGARIKAGI